MNEIDIFYRYGIALAIGFLVGFQREFTYSNKENDHAGGVRTFSIIGLLGCAGANLADIFHSPAILGVVILCVTLFFAINYYIESKKINSGLTTAMAAVMTALVGALAYWSQLQVAVALGVLVTVLLSAKDELHKFARKVSKADLTASLKFAVISAVVLPVLPDSALGEGILSVVNPFKIWLLVVFISGISFVGFILMKVVGAARGIGITGLLGGIASSTAVTLSFTQRSKDAEGLAPSFALAIIMAWTIMFARVIVEIAVVNSALVPKVIIPLSIIAASGLLYCIYLYYKQKSTTSQTNVDFSNPFELKPAIKFGIIFTLILIISNIAQIYFGDAGIYVSSFASGLADVDAMALSVAELSLDTSGLSLDVAADAVVIAALANTLSKGLIVVILGAPALRKSILPAFILMIAAGMLSLFFV